jgi:hypothetical protein
MIFSFIGEAPVNGLNWLFTDKGRLCLLLFALAVGFWPQISKWIEEQELLRHRPMSKRKLKAATEHLYRDMSAWFDEHPEMKPGSEANLEKHMREVHEWREGKERPFLTRDPLDDECGALFAHRCRALHREFVKRGVTEEMGLLHFLKGPTANNAAWLWDAIKELRTLTEQL